MELHDYLIILRKRWVSIVLVTALLLAGAAAASLLVTPTYDAKSQVFVSVNSGGTTADLLQGSSYSQNQVKSYTDLVTSPRVLSPVIDRLALNVTPDTLAKSVAADSPLNTVLINITVTSAAPKMASDIANAIADSLGTQVAELEKPTNGQSSPIQVSTVRTATAPTAPSSPKTKTNLALGLVLGILLGFGLAVLREVLDTKVRTEADVHKVTDASVIASIGYDADAPQHPLIVQTSPQSHRSEAFRRLRTNLQFLDIADRPKTIVVTSSLPGEGKSTTAINLAITLADAGSRVVLVDADLRRPSVAEYMGVEGQVGLTTVLIGRATVQDVVQPWGNGYLHILPSGQVPPNPSELLGSRSMANLLDQLAQLYDIVLLDTPPMLPVTDAAILAKMTGGALVVVGADWLNRQQLAEAMGSLETVGARVLGVVLNRLARTPSDSYMYYDYTTSDPASSGKKKRSAPSGRTRQPPRRASGRRSPSRPDRGDAVDRSRAVETVDTIFGAPPTTSTNRWPGEPLTGERDSRTARRT
ncbi:MAG: polysaccharide biosynthesis tyrosine autokinase [Phycicoccus sp.]|nr:polysaccharide biosynthesis tyrosine autokinase [Phycicoccus sp.]